MLTIRAVRVRLVVDQHVGDAAPRGRRPGAGRRRPCSRRRSRRPGGLHDLGVAPLDLGHEAQRHRPLLAARGDAVDELERRRVRERLGEGEVEHQPDRPRLPLRERPRHGVRARVAELAGGGEDALAQGGGELVGAVEGVGHGHARDADRCGHGGEGGSAAGVGAGRHLYRSRLYRYSTRAVKYGQPHLCAARRPARRRRPAGHVRSGERVSMSGRMTDTPSAPAPPRVLVICSDRIGKQMAGPAIRAYELAKALRPHASEVMLAGLETDAEPLDDVDVVQYHIRDQRRIKPLIARADVIVAQPPWPRARRLAAQLRRADRLRPLRPRAARGARVALAPQHAPAPRARHAHRRPRRRRAARRPPPDLRVGEAARPLARGA